MKKLYYLLFLALLLATCTHTGKNEQQERIVKVQASVEQLGMEYTVESLRVSLIARIDALSFGKEQGRAVAAKAPKLVPITASEAIKANGVPE